MAEKPRVFISYARKDGEAFARNLHKRLVKVFDAEALIWWDRAQMEGGKGWWTQIEKAIDTADFLVLVMTPGAMASPYTRKEWQYARQGGKCVYPVKGGPGVDFDTMPSWMRKAHFFDLDKEWKSFISHLRAPCQA